jgi:ABC-type Mn2+/Zn2+ transport system ATPase subunit
MSSHHLDLRDVTVSYHGIPAIHHLSLHFSCGDCVALLGPNGAGKSTLLKAIVGLVPLETGTISFHDHAIRRGSKEIAYLPQRENIDWDFPITVRGLVEMGRYAELGWNRTYTNKDAALVDKALQTMNLLDLAERQLNALSGGQQQRAFLARALAQEAHVLLLDEPFSGLDKNAQANLGSTLKSLAAEGHLVLASHHDLKNVSEIFDHAVLLNGELIAEGLTTTILTAENLRRTFETPVYSGHQATHP